MSFRKKHAWLVIFALAGALLPGPPAAQARDVTLTTVNWSPFFDETLPGGGFLARLVSAALAEAGHRTVIVYRPWKRGVEEARAGRFDGVLGAYHTGERQRHFLFSAPLYVSRVGLVASRQFPVDRYETLRDLAPYTIATAAGWAYSPEFDAAGFLRKDIGVDEKSGIRKLLVGRVDLLAINLDLFQYRLAHQPDLAAGRFKIVTPEPRRAAIHVMFPRVLKASRSLVADLDRGLDRLTRNGRRGRLLGEFHQLLSTARRVDLPAGHPFRLALERMPR